MQLGTALPPSQEPEPFKDFIENLKRENYNISELTFNFFQIPKLKKNSGRSM